MSTQSNQARAIFLEAIEEHSPETRVDFLEQACAGDAKLRERVERLLQSHQQLGSFHDESPAAATVNQPHAELTEQPGDTIGPYKLLQQIGEGGMGVVYMAEQTEPVERRVALKIIKPGMDSRQVIARFEAERQALAMMDHPNIAKVLDAGTTDTGRPYFVMELVKGLPITQYCDEQHLTPRERLELFLPICQAVQHAHQKGVIHRDLKPSNILVARYDDRAVPKIIDFGVAKAVSQKLTEKTMFTQYGQIVGTIEYMSPEQAQFNQLDVDTRSDIYSLGVLLYELLTGETPFDKQRLRSAAFDELLRIIREEEPPCPSVKLSTSETLPSIAANRQIEPHKLGSLVQGELDWIVMKALEKDRTRRYETASAFAADVQHYLSDEAVVACPPSAAYRFRKFARRNRAAIATTTAIALALIVGAGVATWQAVRATRAAIDERQAREDADRERSRAVAAEQLAEDRLQRERQQRQRAEQAEEQARREAAISKAVNDFLGKDLLGMADAARQVEGEIAPDPDVRLRTLLDRATERVQERFTEQPLVEASVRNTLGNAYYAIGEYEEAEEQHRRALQLRERILGAEHRDTLYSMNNLANALVAHGSYFEAEELYRGVLQVRQRVLAPEHPDTLTGTNNLANSIKGQGRYSEAERLYRDVLLIQQRALGPEHRDTLATTANLALVIRDQGRYAEAEDLHRDVLRILMRDLGPEHPDTLGSKLNLALAISDQARSAEAEELYRQTLDVQRRVLGPEHPDTLSTMSGLACEIAIQGRWVEAEELYREVLQIRRRVLGPEHPDTVRCMHDLALLIHRREVHAEAEELYRELLPILQQVLGPEHPDALACMLNLATAIEAQGRSAEAEELHRELLPIQQRVLGAEHPDTLGCMNNLASAIKNQGRYSEAEQLFRDVLELKTRVLGPEHPSTLRSMDGLANAIRRQERYVEAEGLYRNLLQIQQRILTPEHPETLGGMHNLAAAIHGQGRYVEAEQLYRDLLPIQQSVLGAEHPKSLRCMNDLAFALGSQGRHREEEDLHREVLQSRIQVLGRDHPDSLNSMRNLAGAIASQERYAEADTLLREALETQQGVLGPEHPDALLTMNNLAVVLNMSGHPAEAEELFRRSLDISTSSLGAEHPSTRRSRSALRGFCIRRGEAHALEQEWGQAAVYFAHAVELNAADHTTWYRFVLTHLADEGREGYREACARLLGQFGDTDDASTVGSILQCCSLAPGAIVDPQEFIRLAEKPLPEQTASHLYSRATTLYRAGRYEQALAELEEIVELRGEVVCVWDWLFLAMTHHQLGHVDDAQQWLARAGEWLDDPAHSLPWDAELDLDFLRREAEALLETETEQQQTESQEPVTGTPPASS